MSSLRHVYGKVLVVRPPVPATCNKAGANYKSEVAHLEYSPRRAYDEWLTILDGIIASGGDAVLRFEEDDDAFLDKGDLQVAADGAVRPVGSRTEVGDMRNVLTGRVFTANGPWVVVEGRALRAVMPNVLEHRRAEATYYHELLAELAELGGYQLEVSDDPWRWEGMADIAVVGEQVVLTYAVPGHYDATVAPKSRRSSREGVDFAADFVGVPESQRVYVELVYPHFHGDTVHFGARPTNRSEVLVHYAGGLWGDGHDRVAVALGQDRLVAISLDDAIHQYAGNARQVGDVVLVPEGVSDGYLASLRRLGLTIHQVPLFELFGKAGGGPA